MQQYSDAARRCADIVTSIATIENAIGNFHYRWVAIRLSDGGYDGNTYDTRSNAIRHNQDLLQVVVYVKVPPSGMTAREAEAFLSFHRKAHDAGFRLTDPEDPTLIPPITNEGFRSQFKRLGTK